MDLDAIKKCKSEEDLDHLMMEDVLRGYTDQVCYPNYEQVAIVDHLGSYNLDQVIAFFDAVYQDLRIPFQVGDAISVNRDGRIFHRYFLYSEEESEICSQFSDWIYRRQDPEIVRLDGITIDLAEFTVTFKEDGEVLCYDSEAHLKIGLDRILSEYWAEESHPDVRIEDNISEFPEIKWLVESFSDFLMSMESQADRITLASRVATFIPELAFELNPDDYLPFTVALQMATHMNRMDPTDQGKVLSSLTLVFGLFDEYRTDLND